MLSVLLAERERTGRPIKVGIIGTGKFGGGLVTQISQLKGMVVAAIADGTIDVISSGHDPRGPEDKRLPFADADPGMAGAETLLSTTLTLVRDGVIDLPRAFDLLAGAPARLLGVGAGVLREGHEGDIALVDPAKPWIVDRRKMAATADNTPFDGQPMQGRVLGLWKGGVRVD